MPPKAAQFMNENRPFNLDMHSVIGLFDLDTHSVIGHFDFLCAGTVHLKAGCGPWRIGAIPPVPAPLYTAPSIQCVARSAPLASPPGYPRHDVV